MLNNNPNGGDVSRAKPFVYKPTPQPKIKLPVVKPVERKPVEKYQPEKEADYRKITEDVFEL